MNYKNTGAMIVGMMLMAIGLILTASEMGYTLFGMKIIQNIAEIVKLQSISNSTCDILLHVIILIVGIFIFMLGVGPSKKIGQPS